MQINLYTCSAEHNRVDKRNYISNSFIITGYLKNRTSALSIEIEIEKSNPIKYDYNYMYIYEFDRYYFIDDIINTGGNRWIIKATVDVLFSFKNDILGNMAIVEKIENSENANLYLNDGSYVMDSRKYNEVKEFPSGFNENGSYILICAGGV